MSKFVFYFKTYIFNKTLKNLKAEIRFKQFVLFLTSNALGFGKIKVYVKNVNLFEASILFESRCITYHRLWHHKMKILDYTQ